MKKLLMLAAMISAFALAAPFTLKPSKIAAGDVRIDQVTKSELETFHFSRVQEAYPYIGIKGVKGPITARAIKDACGIEVRENLKSPGSAKFLKMQNPVYFENAGVYFLGGDVDSQNGYGALLRSHYYCTAVFEGTAKGGTLYTKVDFSRN